MDKSFPRWLGACFAVSMLITSAPSLAQDAVDKGPGSSVKPAATAPASSAEEKARQEEDDRKRKATEVRNKAIEANNRGVELQAKNNNADALKAFQESLQIDPSYERARENLAIAYYNLGSESINAKKWADAIDNYEAARTYDREMRERTTTPLAVAYNNQAAALVEAKRLDDAVAAMTQAANLDPKYQSELTKLKAYRDQVASSNKKPTK
jgi:tetratricopeptide (TPR) repeat protein